MQDDQAYGIPTGDSAAGSTSRRVPLAMAMGRTVRVDRTIPHDRLMARVQEKIADGPVLKMIASFLKAEILEGARQWTPEAGAPQGAVLSPLLSNVYLDPLDHFLGYHFRGTKRGICHWARAKSIRKLKDTLRPLTRRQSGESLAVILAKVNRTLQGWFVYFQHSRPWIFPRLDSWIRRRLRSILRKRSKRRGISQGHDHQRWKNAFFTAQGLFNLEQARGAVCQSSRR